MYDPNEPRTPQPPPTPTYPDARQSPEDPEEIAEDIAHTRDAMSETIDAIEDRLSPQRLKEEAKQAMRDQTVGRAEQAMHSGEQTVKQTGQNITSTIKQHPIPAAMVGIGLGWLFMESRKSSDGHSQSQQMVNRAQSRAGEFAGEAEHRAEHMAHQATDQAQYMGEQVSHQAHQAKSQMQRMLHENPLAVGVIALGAGAAFGAILPGTRKEDELMGQAREEAVHQVEQKAQDTLHKAENVARETAGQAQQVAKQEAKKQNLTG